MNIPPEKLAAFRGMLTHMIADKASEDVINQATEKFKAMYSDGAKPQEFKIDNSSLQMRHPTAPQDASAFPNTRPGDKQTSMMGTPITQALFPRMSQVDATGNGNAPLAYAHDIASIPGRAIASLPEAIKGGGEGLMHGMADIKGNTVTGNILRSPSTSFMAAAAPLTGGASLLAGSAIAGGIGALDNQIDNYSQGEKIDPVQGLKDAAMYTAGGYGIGKALPYVVPAVKAGASYLGNKTLQSFEAPAQKTILSKLGYDPAIVQNSLPAEAKIGDVADAANRVAKEMKSVDLLHLPEKAYIKTQEGIKKYGDAIGKVGDMASKNGVRANVSDAIDEFYNDFSTGLADKGLGVANVDALTTQFAPKIQAMVDRLGIDENGTLPLDKAMNFKIALQDMVNNFDKSANLPFMQDAAKNLSTKVIETIKNSDPTYGPKILELYKPFSIIKKYEPMINSAYESATGASARGEGGLSVPLMTKHGAIKNGLNVALSPKRWATGLSDKLTEAAANINPLEQVSPGIDFTKTIPRTSTMAMAEEMNRPNSLFSGNTPDLPPRSLIQPREPLQSATLDVSKIDKLKSDLSNATTKYEKQLILKKIRDENLRFPLPKLQ